MSSDCRASAAVMFVQSLVTRPMIKPLALAAISWLWSVPESHAVDVWVTTGDKTKLLRQETDLLFAPGNGSGGFTINVNAASQFQTMDGFGAALTDSSAWLIENKLNAQQRAQLLQLLFSPESGIGLNYLRLPMGASDFTASGRYTYNDQPSGQSDPDQDDFSVDHDRQYIIPQLLAAKALNPHLQLMGSPWSAPAWMKTNLSLFGGQLQPRFEASYARYLHKFIEAYAAEGLPFEAISLQNEPLHTRADYPTMGMSPAQQTSIIKNHLGPALAAAGLETKILVYDHNWDQPGYPLEVLGDPEARPYIAGTAFHGYAGDVAAQSIVHEAYPDKGIYFTEITGGDFAPNFADNLVFGLKHVIIGGTRHWSKNALYWNLALDDNHGPHLGGCSNCRGVVTIDSQTGQVTPNEEFYTLAHVSKFVQPGATRIDSRTIDNVVETTAFVNPDGSKVLVALNPSGSSKAFRVVDAGKHVSYSLPAKSVATFAWDAATTAAADFDNGGFDDLGGSLGAWTVFGNSAGNVAASTLRQRSGAASLRLAGQNGAPDNYSGVSQGMSVVPGELVRVSASSLVDAASELASGNHAVMKLEFFSTFNGEFGAPELLAEHQVTIADAISPTNQWQMHQLQAIAPPDAAEARLVFYFFQPSGAGGAVFIDDAALQLGSPLNADFDQNGVVDGIDLAVWTQYFGLASSAEHGQGDATGDGMVDGSDFLLWQRETTLPTRSPTGKAVPEPQAKGFLAVFLSGAALYNGVRSGKRAY